MPEPDPTRAGERLTDLEIALTHQEAALEDLSAVLREQAARIDRLAIQLARLAQRLDEAEAGAPPEADQRPPHW